MNELDRTRAKILGVLIQDARLHAGCSRADCAQALGMSEEDLTKTEAGEYALSLPHLEALAMYLKVPLDHFWGSKTLGDDQQMNYEELLALRRRMIGALLRQARLQARRSVQDVAEGINVDVARLQAYEAGVEPIPLFELERLGKYLGLTLDYFVERRHGPLAEHETEQRMQQRFEALPPEVKAFVVEPINLSYLETAMRLSEMNVDRLRSIAESILDITF